MMETWLPVKGYEGVYEVSDHGNVRRVHHLEPYFHRQSRTYRVSYRKRNYVLCRDFNNVRSEMAAWHIPEVYYTPLEGSLDSDGYIQIRFSIGEIRKMVKAHRLVAEAFLPAPLEEQNEVNHRDLNKANNNDWNLEWCTSQENKIHYRENKHRLNGEVKCT